MCVIFQGLYVAQREILGFWAPDIGFLVFLDRELFCRLFGFQDDVCRCLWLHVTQREILGFWALCTVFRVFKDRILCIWICMGLFDSFSVQGSFLGFHDIFIPLVTLEREWSAHIYRLAVRREQDREFCIQGLHGFALIYYGSVLIVYYFHGDVCHCIGFLFRLERGFRVLGFRYIIFRVFRERNLRVWVCMRLVDFFSGCMVRHRDIMVLG